MSRRAYTGYRESRNQHLYNDFTEIEADELPKVGEEWRDGIVYAVNEERLDCEQPNDDNFKFNYYYIEWIDGDGDECGEYVCFLDYEYKLDDDMEYIQKDLFEKLKGNSKTSNCEDASDFVEFINEENSGGNLEFLATTARMFGSEVVDSVISEYDYSPEIYK